MSDLTAMRSMVWLLAATGTLLALALAVAWWLRARAARVAHRRAAARRIVECVKAYGAWMDCQRAEPPMEMDADADASVLPEPLSAAVAIKDQWLPELGPAMLRLLRTHAATTEMLWQHHILRISQVEPQRAIYEDPDFQALRDQQDAAIDHLIAECRRLAGDTVPQWRGTRSDFGFTSGLSLPSHPGSRP
jgi:hypothetical protein